MPRLAGIKAPACAAGETGLGDICPDSGQEEELQPGGRRSWFQWGGRQCVCRASQRNYGLAERKRSEGGAARAPPTAAICSLAGTLRLTAPTRFAKIAALAIRPRSIM